MLRSAHHRHDDRPISATPRPGYPPSEGREFSEMMALEEIGLLNFNAAMLSKEFDVNHGLALHYKHHVLVLEPSEPSKVRMSAAPLTRVGRELYGAIDVEDNISAALYVVDHFPKDKLARALYGHVGAKEGKLLWPREPQETPQ